MTESSRSSETSPDRRVRRSRASIIAAFNRLILDQGYGRLTPGIVAEAADVGRSTFYQHFAGLDDLLAQSLIPILRRLAESCFERLPPDAARRTLDHLWENRRLARVLLGGDTREIVQRAFAEQFVSALGERKALSTGCVEADLIGLCLAAGQLTLLMAWVSGRSSCSADQIAWALHASGRGTIQALLTPSASG